MRARLRAESNVLRRGTRKRSCGLLRKHARRQHELWNRSRRVRARVYGWKHLYQRHLWAVVHERPDLTVSGRFGPQPEHSVLCERHDRQQQLRARRCGLRECVCRTGHVRKRTLCAAGRLGSSRPAERQVRNGGHPRRQCDVGYTPEASLDMGGHPRSRRASSNWTVPVTGNYVIEALGAQGAAAQIRAGSEGSAPISRVPSR